jgi:hypothetical protein
MTRFFIAGVAVLFLATEAQAQEHRWVDSFRRCQIERNWVSGDNYPLDLSDAVITPKDIPDIEAGLKTLKRCAKFWKCVEDRDAGKVKHCYENDRRWR